MTSYLSSMQVPQDLVCCFVFIIVAEIKFGKIVPPYLNQLFAEELYQTLSPHNLSSMDTGTKPLVIFQITSNQYSRVTMIRLPIEKALARRKRNTNTCSLRKLVRTNFTWREILKILRLCSKDLCTEQLQ